MIWRRKPSSGPAATPAHRESAEPVALTIDALGRKCPIPIIMLADQITHVPTGAVVSVLADDPAAFTDIPAWCRLKSHEHIASHELPKGGWSILVRRKY